MDTPTEVRLSYRNEVHRASPEQHFLFGRGAGNDLNVERETDEFVHRRLGRIYHHGGAWWITNDGSRLSLAINDRATTSSIVLAPGATAALSFAHASIHFNGQRASYEILVDFADATMDHGEVAVVPTSGMDESTASGPRLVGEQRLLLVAMAEGKLRQPHAPLVVPSNKAVANRFGWGRKTLDGKLGRLCEKFDRWGMAGLVGETAEPATERRRRLVSYALDRGLISVDDLALLDEYPPHLP